MNNKVLDSNKPILFIFGAPRSGTTFVSHTVRDIFDHGICWEGKFIADLAKMSADITDDISEDRFAEILDIIDRSKMLDHFRKEFPGILGRPIDISKEKIGCAAIENSTRGLIHATLVTVAKEMDKTHLGNKFPDYWRCLPQLLAWFPNARFLHVCRDGRDVALSTEKKHWGGNSAFACSLSWRAAIDAATAFEKIVPENQYLKIQYEVLMADPESTLLKLERFLGVAVRPELKKDFYLEMKRNPLKKNFGKWRSQMPKSEIRRYEAVAGAQLVSLGYPLLTKKPKMYIVEKLYFAFLEFVNRPTRAIQYLFRNRSIQATRG